MSKKQPRAARTNKPKAKKVRAADPTELRLYNASKQTVIIEAKPPQGDFFRDRQTIHIRPGQSVLIKRQFLNMNQITNLQKKRFLKILYDSSTQTT